MTTKLKNGEVWVKGRQCLQCSHIWVPVVEHPHKCPNCNSRNWDKRPNSSSNKGRQIIDQKNKKVYLNGKLMCDYND